MKKCFYMIIFFIFQSFTALASNKLAIVNVSDIFQHSIHREKVAQQLEEEFKDRITELQVMERELQEKINNFQKQSSSLNENERNILEQSLIVQREELSNKAKAFQQDNHYRQTEERDKILNIINDAVKKIANKCDYNLVIDSSAIVYSDNIKDITGDVSKLVK